MPERQLREAPSKRQAHEDATEIRLLRESPVMVAPNGPLTAQVSVEADARDQFLLNSRTGGKIDSSVPINLEIIVESIHQRPWQVPLRELPTIVADLPSNTRVPTE